MDRKLALPAETEWLSVNVPEVYVNFSDGSRFTAPSHSIQAAPRYPTFEDGELVANVTQAQAAQFLRDYNKANGTKFRYPTLFEDEAIRELGKDHALFDENFQRNGTPWRWGYVADFNKPYGQAQEGIDQQLVTRVVGFRMPDGDYEIGSVTIAPSGMVPALSRVRMEKRIGAEGLKRLEHLRGREIYEKGDQVVDVKNALGYPQFTLGHNASDEIGLIPHSHHFYTPSQQDGERVGIRGAGWRHHGVRRCFDVDLSVDPARSGSSGSVPLIRGGNVEAEVVRPGYKIGL